MKQSLRKTTYEDAVAHGEALFAALEETEAYSAVKARAATLGVTIMTSVRHTYTEEYADTFKPTCDHVGQVPLGYAMELWFDLVRDGRVLMTSDGETQCSYGAPAIECTSVFFINRLNFRELDDVLSRSPVCAMLEEFLDGIEEGGAHPSPFVSNDAVLVLTDSDRMGAKTRAEVHEGAYTELARGAYTGEIGGETSVYFAEGAFLPYRLFLHAVTDTTERFTGESLTLDEEHCEAMLSLLEEAEVAVRRQPSFTDLYMEVCESPLAPPPHTEVLLDSLTVCRREAFAEDCETFAALLRDCINEEMPVTVIW